MISLDDKIWKELTSAYKIPYDASVILKRLEQTTDSKVEDEIWDEIWQELHHQGDIGTASYLTVPHLIRIAKLKKKVGYNTFGFISTIEIQRHVEGNPSIPETFIKDYLDSLIEIYDLIEIIKNDKWDNTVIACSLAAIAVTKGHIELGKVLLEMEDPELINSFDEFMKNY